MTAQPPEESVVVIPSSTNSNPHSVSGKNEITTPSNNLFGTITKTIGTGENAKNSIVWMTITWSFVIATGISFILLIFLGIAYFQDKESLITDLTKNITTVWSIFTPIITLALGYAFGRNETK